MLEITVICLFSAILLLCIALNISILYALLLGYALFCAYGLIKRHTLLDILKMSAKGIYTVRTIVTTFVLIGMITAVWRACGTIPFIIYHASKVIVPSVFVLVAFLICCLISLLTGTAFGSAATVGVICMTISNAMGINPALTGGAIVSGIFFGDRCSPMSTSALLVSQLTTTDIYTNIRNMFKTSIVPFVLACVFYLGMGLSQHAGAASTDVWDLFADNYSLHWAVSIPALIIVAMCVLRVKVKLAMAASIAAGVIICVAVQGMPISALPDMLVNGFKATNASLALMMNGGGVMSMARVIAIVCLSSSFAGIFECTGLLDGIKGRIMKLGEKTTPFFCVIATSVVTNMIACNQTLAVMLTHQLCDDITEDKYKLAIYLENSVIVISALIPWSIAVAAPLTTIAAPSSSIIYAFYLYTLTIWNYIVDRKRKQPQPV